MRRKRIHVKLLYSAAFIIIFAAILVVVSRAVTPLLDRYLPDIEAKTTALVGTPVSIQRVHIGWYQYQPEISLDHVTVFNHVSKDPVFQIEQVNLLFSIPRSLIQRQLVLSGIVIVGSHVHVEENAKGEIGVRGLPGFKGSATSLSQHDTALTDILGSLFNLPQLVMDDIHIDYTSKTGATRELTLYHLRFENSGGVQHNIVGKALLHGVASTGFTFQAKWQGNQVDPHDIDADLYLYVSNFDLATWCQQHTWQGWHVERGFANAKIWASWRHGQFETVQSNFKLFQLDVYSDVDRALHRIARLRGELGFKREGERLVVAGNKIEVDFPLHHWPTTSFYLTMMSDTHGQWLPTALKLNYLNLGDVKALLLGSQSLLSADNRHFLQSLQLSGDIEEVSMVFTPPYLDLEHTSLIGRFSKMHIAPTHHLPGLHHVAGTLHWDGQEGDLTLNTKDGTIKDNDIFANPIPLDQLTGDIFWKRGNNQKWVVGLKKIQLSNADLTVEADGNLLIPAAQPVSADLEGRFTVQHAEHVTQYLPLRLFDDDLNQWLKKAFLSGSVTDGKAVLRGSLRDFPPARGEGGVVVSGVVHSMNFHFAPDWPNLEEMQANLTFSGKSMKVEVLRGKLSGITIGRVTGNIPDLGHSVLQVQSDDINTDFTTVLKVVKASPLRTSFEELLERVSITGPLTLKLGLMLPLSTPDKMTVKGDIHFNDTVLALTLWNLKLDHLKGVLQFTENTTSADHIQGELFGKPVTLALTTKQPNAAHPVTEATLNHDLSIQNLERWLGVPLSSVVSGAAPVTTQIDFASHSPTTVHMTSNLVGIAVNLPVPYAKPAAEARSFLGEVVVQDASQPLRLSMQYGDLLGAALLLTRHNQSLNLMAADLNLGSGAPPFPEGEGLYITGKLPKLDWETIQQYLHQDHAAALPGGLVFRHANVTFGTLQLPGLTLNQINLQLTPLKAGFELGVNSAYALGTLQIPSKWDPAHTVTALFQKLNLSGLVFNNTPVGDINVATLPAFSIHAKQVGYQKTVFDQVTIQTMPNSKGLVVQMMNLSAPNLTFRATGEWTNTGTHLKGEAQSSRTSNVLNNLGLDVHNFVASKGNLNFDVSWKGSPFAFTPANLNGQAIIDIGEGRIVELSESTNAKMDLGRMLSLFSLQTIPRRLNLDFSDIFQKGYSFDVFKGDVTFVNGDANSKDTYFDGPVARVAIAGRIGLAKKDYNLALTVTPHVTSSIPVAATILTGQPVIGIAAWAIEKVVSPTVTKATSYRYTVTGPWNNPNWQEAKR
jgi:uncharacterized protein (TIGR02099 family)